MRHFFSVIITMVCHLLLPVYFTLSSTHQFVASFINVCIFSNLNEEIRHKKFIFLLNYTVVIFLKKFYFKNILSNMLISIHPRNSGMMKLFGFGFFFIYCIIFLILFLSFAWLQVAEIAHFCTRSISLTGRLLRPLARTLQSPQGIALWLSCSLCCLSCLVLCATRCSGTGALGSVLCVSLSAQQAGSNCIV